MTGNGLVPAGVRRSPTSLNSPDWKVISSILAGWGCLAQAGTSSTSRIADSLIEIRLGLEMSCVFIVISLQTKDSVLGGCGQARPALHALELFPADAPDGHTNEQHTPQQGGDDWHHRGQRCS